MNRIPKLMRFSAVIVGFCAGLLPAGSSHAETYRSEYRLSSYVGTSFQLGQGAQKWADLVAERTKGRINVKLYPNSSLVGGDGTREFSAMRQGLVDMNVASVINLAPNVKALNLFLLPFLIKDERAFDALINGETGKKLFEAFDGKGVVPLAWGENGFRDVSNSRHPISRPADLGGLKIRVVGSPIFTDIFRQLGANPTDMTFSDLQPALQSGAVDGQENPIQYFLGTKMPQVRQKYLTRWAYVNDALVFSVSKKVWDSWTPSDRTIVAQAARDAAKFEIAAARKGLVAGDDSLIVAAKSEGVQITELTDAQRQVFIQSTQPVFDKWRQIVGADLVDVAKREVTAAR